MSAQHARSSLTPLGLGGSREPLTQAFLPARAQGFLSGNGPLLRAVQLVHLRLVYVQGVPGRIGW